MWTPSQPTEQDLDGNHLHNRVSTVPEAGQTTRGTREGARAEKEEDGASHVTSQDTR